MREQPKSLTVIRVFALMTLICVIVTALPKNAAAERSYSWVRATAAAPWPARFSSAIVAFDGKLWVIGGTTNWSDVAFGDIWRSGDGANWTEVTANAPFGGRYGHIAEAFAGKIWLLAGSNNNGISLADVWSSGNGVNWTQVTPMATCLFGISHAASVLDDRLWFFRYSSNAPPSLDDVWFSSEGSNWTQATSSVPWHGRYGFACVSFEDRLCMLGGEWYDLDAGLVHPMNDVWCSLDGANWTQVITSTVWPGRQGHAVAVFDNKLWVLGGGYTVGIGQYSYFQFLNDVWYSSDGQNWTQLPDAPWSPRMGLSAVVLDGKLWVLGGEGGEGANVDVWYLTGAEPPTVSIETGHAPWYQIGEPLDMKVVGTGLSGAETYYWQKDGSALDDATTSIYHLDAIASSDGGSYSCEVIDPANTGTLTAGPVLITVLPPGSRLPLMSAGVVLLVLAACAVGARALHR